MIVHKRCALPPTWILFSGVGPFGFPKRFSISDVLDVRIEDRRWRDSDGDSRRRSQIVLDTKGKSINFGSMLTPQRRQFVAGALRKELIRR